MSGSPAIPDWAPTPIPERPPEPVEQAASRARLVAVAVSCVLVLAGGAFALRHFTRPPAEPVAGPVLVIDSLLADMRADRWDAAYARFDPECRDFSVEIFQASFGPLVDRYRTHEVTAPESLEMGLNGMLRVIGVMELDPGTAHSIRADLTPASAEPGDVWQVCGFRIDEA